jgi:hypothetical protein
VGDGNLDKRLTLAGDAMVRLRAEDVPESLRLELEAIKAPRKALRYFRADPILSLSTWVVGALADPQPNNSP